MAVQHGTFLKNKPINTVNVWPITAAIYFAIGVSGASQHLAGITNAKCVIAINRDEEANIFKRARFGIVEDYKKVVPILIETIKKAK